MPALAVHRSRVEFELNAGGELDAQAANIAKVFDSRTAECAYAAQAAFAHLEAKRPELKALPASPSASAAAR